MRLTTTDKTDYIFIDMNTPPSHMKGEQHKLNYMNPYPHMTLTVCGTLYTNSSINDMKKSRFIKSKREDLENGKQHTWLNCL